MNCQQIRSLVEDILDRRLQGRQALEVKRHLDHCAECREFLERERAQSDRWFSLLNDVADIPPLAEDFESRFLTEVQRQHRTEGLLRHWWSRRRAKTAAAVAALLAFASFAAWQGASHWPYFTDGDHGNDDVGVEDGHEKQLSAGDRAEVDDTGLEPLFLPEDERELRHLRRKRTIPITQKESKT